MSQNQIQDNRKPYETPVVTTVGKVEEVTQGSTNGGTDTLGLLSA